MQTIDVTAKEWFDRVNGNSYFSGRVVIDYGTPKERTLYMPFQYGYGEQYQAEAWVMIAKSEGFDGSNGPLWHYCQDNNIILRTQKLEKCLKREAVTFGEGA